MIRAGDVTPGTVFVCRDVLDGEIRNTFYLRDPDGPCRYPASVRVALLGYVQQRDGETRAQYRCSVPCRDPGEMQALMPCSLESDFPGILAEFAAPLAKETET